MDCDFHTVMARQYNISLSFPVVVGHFMWNSTCYRSFKRNPDGTNSMSAHHPLNPGAILDEPTWRCHQNPFVGALRIQEPVILGEPQIKG